MRITKYGHSCLLVEEQGVRILLDPGKWNQLPDAANLDAILITHEHADHLDIGQVQSLLVTNSTCRIITHEAVGRKLAEAGISYEAIEEREVIEVKGVSVQSYGTTHACVYGDLLPCRNTGFLIDTELFISGDALTEFPNTPARVLALPCGAPWMKFSEAIDYAKKLKPQIVFPVHDGMYKEEIRADLIPRIIGGNLESSGIQFVDLGAGEVHVF